MLQALSLAAPGVYSPRSRPLPAAPYETPRRHGACGCRRRSSIGAGSRWLRLRQRAARPTRLELPAFEIDRLPVTNADLRASSSKRAATAARAAGREAGWAWREAEGVERPLYWTEDGGERRFDRVRAADPRAARDARVLVRGGRLRALARASACRARPSGRRPPHGTRHRRAAAYPWGDTPPERPHANLDQTGFGPAPAGAYPAGASPYGALGMVGRLPGSGPRSEFGALPRLRRVPLPRVLGGLLRRRIQGVARRRVGDTCAGAIRNTSATGTSRSAARSSPASAAQGR